MRKLMTTVAAFICLATPAFAIDCDGQAKIVDLDFKTAGGKPLTSLELRIIGEHCTDGAGYYQLKGMPGHYQSAADAKSMYDRIRQLKFDGITAESFDQILKFVGEKEGQKTAAK